MRPYFQNRYSVRSSRRFICALAFRGACFHFLTEREPSGSSVITDYSTHMVCHVLELHPYACLSHFSNASRLASRSSSCRCFNFLVICASTARFCFAPLDFSFYHFCRICLCNEPTINTSGWGWTFFPPRIMNAPPASKRKDRQGIVVARLLQWVHFIMGTFKTYAHGCTAMQSVAQHIMMLQHLNQSSQSYLANVGRETQLLIIAEQGVTTCHGFRVAGRSATVCFQLPELWFHTFLQRQLLLATMRWWQGDTFLDRAPQSKKRRVHMCCMWMGVQWWQE